MGEHNKTVQGQYREHAYELKLTYHQMSVFGEPISEEMVAADVYVDGKRLCAGDPGFSLPGPSLSAVDASARGYIDYLEEPAARAG